MIKIAINGILGRMGQELVTALQDSETFQLVGGLDARVEAGPHDYPVTADPAQVLPRCDVAIDFSGPSGAMDILQSCLKYQKPLVSGTTGLTPEQRDAFRQASHAIPIVQSFNFSVGINLLLKLVELAARILKESVDIEIVEKHHRFKKDAPSGTALLLAERIARELNLSGEDAFVFGRHGKELQRGKEIGLHAVRGGAVVGEHSVFFLGENENVTLHHQALNRRIFVDGALRAAKWVLDKPAGLYTMDQVLSE